MPRTVLAPLRRAAAVAKARQPWDDAEDVFAEDIDAALRALAASAMTSNARQALARGDVATFLGLLDWDTLTYDLSGLQAGLGGAALAEAMAAVAQAGGANALLAFGMVEQRAVNFARQRAASLITEISDQVRDTVRGFIGDALEFGNPINVLAGQIRDVIPLHSRFAQAVENQFERLLREGLTDGKTYDEAMRLATEASQRYAERLRMVRSRNIARTEVMQASQAGRFEGWAAYIGQPGTETGWRKEWITGGNPCPDCDPLDGEIVDWDAEFSVGQLMPPLHNSCRCVATLRSPSTGTRNGLRKAARRNQEHPPMVITYAEGALLVASALAVGRTKTQEEHEAFVLELLEDR